MVQITREVISVRKYSLKDVQHKIAQKTERKKKLGSVSLQKKQMNHNSIWDGCQESGRVYWGEEEQNTEIFTLYCEQGTGELN